MRTSPLPCKPAGKILHPHSTERKDYADCMQHEQLLLLLVQSRKEKRIKKGDGLNAGKIWSETFRPPP